jgi:hypothetical protein
MVTSSEVMEPRSSERSRVRVSCISMGSVFPLENEDWQVDQDGVAGGEDVWKEADMEETAENYRAEWNCF